MQITIDTKHDSKEEIRKAIKMLMGLVSHSEPYTNDYDTYEPKSQNIFEQPSSDMSGMMGIFDTPATETKEEQKEDVPTMEFY